ncbi:MAG: UvrB/UvrC motif-containing protein [Victivallales bacterium]|nr:UvrB/UvrC motif-containing protein [Victivallales bacterium]
MTVRGCPSRVRASPARDRLLRGQRLRQQLDLAVAAEDYERASLLRDEIKSLASVDDGPGDGS